MEACWTKTDDPLTCLTCKRLKGKTLLDKPSDPLLAAFADGFGFAIVQFAAYLKHTLTKEQIAMMQAIDLRFKCSLDRGINIETLQTMLQNITVLMLKEILAGKPFCPHIDPTHELFGVKPEKSMYEPEKCKDCPLFKRCWS